MHRAAFGLLLLLLLPGHAAAHLLNMSRVEADFAADASVEVRLELDLTVELGGAAAYHAASQAAEPLADPALAAMAGAAARSVRLTHDGVLVALQVASLHMPDDPIASFVGGLEWPRARLVLRGVLPYPAGGEVRMVFDPAFVFEEPIALTLRDIATGSSVTRWLIAEQRSPPLLLGAANTGAGTAGAAGTAGTVGASGTSGTAQPVEGISTLLARYVTWGFTHILPGGLDHLLFVTGLFLGARTLLPLLGLVSLYTLAHTVTLGLAAFSLVRVDSGIVEPLIAFTIVWVAVENLRPAAPLRWRLPLVFVLGLVHGLGFASALREAGLPAEGALWALAGFNAGVELGQLAWLLVLVLVPGLWRQRPWYSSRVVRPASLVIAVVALLWGVQRLVG